MPFSLRETLDWLYEEGTEAAFGPKERKQGWVSGAQIKVPRNTYRRVMFVIADPMETIFSRWSPGEFQKKLPKAAAKAGFRLLKVIPVDLPKAATPFGLRGVKHQVFSAYAASDTFVQPLVRLSEALFWAPIIMGLEDVSLSEKATLDALWVAQGEAERTVAELDDIKKPTFKHQVDVWPLFGLGIATTAVIAGVWALTSLVKEKRYA